MSEAVRPGPEASTERTARPTPVVRGTRKTLPGGLPRRFADHRSRKARQYRELFDAVVERFLPKGRLGYWAAALAADLMTDYTTLRASKRKGTRAQRRKVVGLLFGAWRECRNASSPGGRDDDLAAELARLTER